MEVDIDAATSDFLALGEAMEKILLKNDSLQKELVVMERRILAFSLAEKVSKEEVDKLQEIVAGHHKILSRFSELQDRHAELKVLSSEQRDRVSSLEQKLLNQADSFTVQLGDLERRHQKNVENIQKESQQYVQSEVARYEKLIGDLKQQVDRARIEALDAEKQKQTELVKIKMEHAAQIQKLHHKQLDHVNVSSGSSITRNDIFRKKLEHCQQESRQTIQNLQAKLAECEGKLGEQQHHTRLHNRQHQEQQRQLQDKVRQQDHLLRKQQDELHRSQGQVRTMQVEVADLKKALADKERLHDQGKQVGSKRRRAMFNPNENHLSQL